MDFTRDMLDAAREVGLSGLLDIAFMSVLIYTLIVWFRRSKAFFVLIGIFIIGLIYLAAREFNLQLTAAVFQGFFAVILIAVIIIFQEEIKRLFERLAVVSLNPRIARRIASPSAEEVEVLVHSLTDLAAHRTGALIVLRGRDAIVRHVNGGVELNGRLSEQLIKSLFNKESVTHDGAVILEGDRVLLFGCHLPLSKDLKKIQHGAGTRHAAALGLSELTDALCLVVSEERGTISIARNGEIETVTDGERLGRLLESFFAEPAPDRRRAQVQDLLSRNLREKLTAVGITVALWFFFVHEGRLTFKTFDSRIEYANVPSGLAVREIRPSTIETTLSGARRNFYFIRPTRVRVIVNLEDMKEGYQSKVIQRSNVSFPDKLRLESITPNRIRVILVPENEMKS